MNTPNTRNEALACVAASLLLGAYLSSAADNVMMKVILMSFPPASLAVALRRGRMVAAKPNTQIQLDAQPETFEEVTAGLEIDILTRAS